MTLLQERFAEVGPITAMEAQFARAAVAARGRLDGRDETSIRYALALARCWHVRAPDGRLFFAPTTWFDAQGHAVAEPAPLAEARPRLDAVKGPE